MRKRIVLAAVSLLGALLLVAASANAAEFEKYEITSVGDSLSTTQAGAHPDFNTTFQLATTSEGEPYALTRDVIVHLPPGLVGNSDAFPQCTPLQLGNTAVESECPQDSQVGVTELVLGKGGGISGTYVEPVYNMTPPGSDVIARFGFIAGAYPSILTVRLDPSDYSLVASVEGAPASAALVSASTTFWGVPADPVHDIERITPLEAANGGAPPQGRESSLPETPFMTNPTRCGKLGAVSVTARSYPLPDAPSTKSAPLPQITGCGLLPFSPETAVAPTTSQGTTGTGLDYELDFPTDGYVHRNLNVDSEPKRTEVILPEGLTINPSEAEGLGVCSEGDLANEAYNSPPNAGCPEVSKIGTVLAESPVLNLPARGSLFLAKPYQNPFNTLLAFYLVLKVPERGVLVKIPGKVTADPASGQLTAVFDDLPQLPVSSFQLHFREGARAPLVTPYACGGYQTLSNFSSWAEPALTVPTLDEFLIDSGPSHGPCPTGGLPPLHPGLIAGTINNAAGSYSPFDARIFRSDAEQEITHFSIKLPPGLVATLKGIPFCSDAAIAAAKARTGASGGAEELERPSCPGASEIGHTLVGAGVGDVLTYVPGKLYLAGPYKGSPLSVVSITAAKAGPFDLGTVVVREALRINPETAEVSVDAGGSDPIPHIIQGIPVHLRDIRVYVDRPNFVINPTSCAPTSTASTVLGSGLNFTSESDDNPITVSTRFQAADCGALPFGPKLSLALKGGTRRSQVPALKAVVRARPGEANIKKASVILPTSEFLEQSHIGTVCTRVQFAAGSVPGEGCPSASIYGHASAITPLLDEPISGPVFLRANGGERKLPDLVVALHSGKININLVGFIDSVRVKGTELSRIRNIFASVPDAPVSKFTLEMAGGKRGLLVNSTNICKGKHRAKVAFTGQNGKLSRSAPVLKVRCGKKGKRGGRRGKRPSHRRAGR